MPFLNCQKANFSNFSNIYVGRHSVLFSVWKTRFIVTGKKWGSGQRPGLDRRWIRAENFQGAELSQQVHPAWLGWEVRTQWPHWASLLARELGGATCLPRVSRMVTVDPYPLLPLSWVSCPFPWQWFSALCCQSCWSLFLDCLVQTFCSRDDHATRVHRVSEVRNE